MSPVAGLTYSLMNALRGLLGDRFDLHAAVLAGHDDRPAGRAIDDDPQIQLARDRQPLLDEQARDRASLRTGLMGDQVSSRRSAWRACRPRRGSPRA